MESAIRNLPGFLDYNKSLATVGAAIFALCILAYAMSHSADSEADLHDPKVFRERKDLYRKQRDCFRRDLQAMKELREWKAMNDHYDYVQLSRGMIPSKLVGKKVGDKPFTKCDTWFSEYESHNPPYLILSKSPDSYIVGNLASYDKRQYPESKHGGQGFGHCFVIPRERIFNIVDPDATANQCRLLNEMKDHFIKFWNTADGPPKLLDRVRSAFDEQNLKLKSSGGTTLREDVEVLRTDFEVLSRTFMKCKPDDFEFAFHPYPAISVGHLHMHVFPKKGALRKFSTKIHDWKTIPIEAVLEVEKEDDKENERRLEQLGRG